MKETIFCQRDLWFHRSYWPQPPHRRYQTPIESQSSKSHAKLRAKLLTELHTTLYTKLRAKLQTYLKDDVECLIEHVTLGTWCWAHHVVCLQIMLTLLILIVKLHTYWKYTQNYIHIENMRLSPYWVYDDEHVVCCSVLQCVAVCCSVLQCVAVCCSVLQSLYWVYDDEHTMFSLLIHIVLCGGYGQ